MKDSPKAFITGAATGIGLAMAKAVSGAGYTVIGTAMPNQDVSELRKIGNVQILEADFSHDTEIKNLIAAVRNMDNLQAVISNAGMAVPGPIECVSIDQIKLQYQINVFAPVQIMQGLLPELRKTKGRIIIIGAGQARVSLPCGGPYGSSKSALAAFADSLRAEVNRWGIHVSVIEPGAIKTGILADSKEKWKSVLSTIPTDIPTDISKQYQLSMEKSFNASERAFQTAISPDEFAKIVLAVLNDKNPKPRYLVGREARVLGYISMFPSRLRAKIINRLA